MQRLVALVALGCCAFALVSIFMQSSSHVALVEVDHPVTEESFFSGDSQQLHVHYKKIYKQVRPQPITAEEKAKRIRNYNEASEQVEQIQAMLKTAKQNQQFMHKIETPDFWGGGQTMGLSQQAIQKHREHRMLLKKA